MLPDPNDPSTYTYSTKVCVHKICPDFIAFPHKFYSLCLLMMCICIENCRQPCFRSRSRASAGIGRHYHRVRYNKCSVYHYGYLHSIPSLTSARFQKSFFLAEIWSNDELFYSGIPQNQFVELGQTEHFVVYPDELEDLRISVTGSVAALRIFLNDLSNVYDWFRALWWSRSIGFHWP